MINRDLTLLLLWSWRSGDHETCQRVLGVMELAVDNAAPGSYAPVYNSVGIGVVETAHRDLALHDFVAFVETWPPALCERGLPYTTIGDDEWADDYNDV